MTSFRAFANAAVDRGLHLGDGLFETVLVAAGQPCLLDLHVARLEASCDALGIARPLDLGDGVREALPDLWEEEGRPERAALRLTVTRGPYAGLAPDERAASDVYLVLRALGPEPPRPVDAVVVDAPRIDPSNPLAGHKTLSWMAYVEARRRAVAAGAHVALLRTTDGDVAEADAANLFVVTGGTAVTPPLSRGVLPGITRARVLDALRESGRAAEVRALRDDDLEVADEVFLTSSLNGVVGVRRVDARRLAAPGPLTLRIGVAVAPEG